MYNAHSFVVLAGCAIAEVCAGAFWPCQTTCGRQQLLTAFQDTRLELCVVEPAHVLPQAD